MKQIAPLALTVLVGSALPAQADHHDKSREGTPVVLIGEVTSQPKDFGFLQEKKFQVSTGPSMGEHTLHVSDAVLQDYYGRKRGVSDIQDKMWVRAEGQMMKDARRIKVTRLEIIGSDRTAYHNSIYFTPQTASGTLTTVTSTVAGSRETLSDPLAEAYIGYRTQGPDPDFEAIGPEGILAQLPLDVEPADDQEMYFSAPEDALYDEVMYGELFYSSPSPDSAGDTLNQDTPGDQEYYEDAYYGALYDELMDDTLVVSDVPAPEERVMPDQESTSNSATYSTSESYDVYDPNDEADVHPEEIVDQELLGSQTSTDSEAENASDDAYYDALYEEFLYEEMLDDQRSDIVPDGTLDIREDAPATEDMEQDNNLNNDLDNDGTVDPSVEEGC